MKKIAVTGGLAVGKSTVCEFLAELGAYVVSADEIVRQLLQADSPTGQLVIKLLGSGIITKNQIDRKKISNIVFSNPAQLKALEQILHPAVRHEIQRLFDSVKNNAAYKFFAAEVPLLYEARMENEFDAVITVIADEKIAKDRTANEEEFERRSRFQLPQAAKETKATYVIKNEGDLSALKAQVTALIPQLL
ncbi:MAG: dephospho-CoA kinase [Rhabdochlamydiaceae bacterium]|nr:dephospho-CoA kinase [Rhabdochlamydiaceae bacterium]